MDLVTRIKYIKKHVLEKRNIIFTIILIFIIIIILCCLSTIKTFLFLKNFYIKNNLSLRTILVKNPDFTEEDFEKINSIDNIELNVEMIFNSQTTSLIKEFNDGDLEGKITILPLLSKNDIKIIDGNNLNNSGEIICPKKFYPYSTLYNEAYGEKIISSKIMDGKKILGKTFKIHSENELNDDLLVKVVGTYDGISLNQQLDTCYISMSDFKKVAFPYERIDLWYDENNEKHVEQFEYEGRLIRIDKKENVNKVLTKLQKMGFNAYISGVVDTNYYTIMILIPTIVIFISLLLAIVIVSSIIKKKILYQQKNLGILKVSGYTNSEIIKNNLCETFLIYTFSFAIAFIIYYSLLNILKYYRFLGEFTLYNIDLNLNYIYVSLIYFIFLFLILLINLKVLKKSLKIDIIELLKD